jgi:hypothetical protein
MERVVDVAILDRDLRVSTTARFGADTDARDEVSADSGAWLLPNG